MVLPAENLFKELVLSITLKLLRNGPMTITIKHVSIMVRIIKIKAIKIKPEITNFQTITSTMTMEMNLNIQTIKTISQEIIIKDRLRGKPMIYGIVYAESII